MDLRFSRDSPHADKPNLVGKKYAKKVVKWKEWKEVRRAKRKIVSEICRMYNSTLFKYFSLLTVI